MRNRTARLFLSSSLLLSSAAFVHAQDNSGLTGVVRDATGAIISDATVILTNPAKGLSFTATTNKEGYYRFPNVPPAQGYSATVSHSGFSSFKLDQITLAVGITQTQNAVLNAGETQTLEVSSKNALVTLNTTDASIGNNLDVEIINDLPIQNRQTISALFTLQPGVTSAGAVTGARTDQSSVTVDGMDVNDLSTGQFGNANGGIPADATQEFRATVAGLPSNLGTGSGGQYQIVTKSGTNRFHGNVNEYHRDVVTSSNTWANKNTLPAIARNKLIRNQFGGNLGGPILHNKLFFFADYYNSRTIQALTGVDTVPLDSYRAGNIGYVKTGCSATTSRQDSTPQCIGFQTPADVLARDPAKVGESATIFNLISTRYPHANDLSLGDGVNTGGFRFIQPTQNILYNGVATMDYNITGHQTARIQFHNAHQDSIQSINRFAGDPITRPFQDRSYGYVGTHTWQIGNNKVNQVYYGENTTVFSFPLAYNPLGSTILSSLSGLITTPYDGGNIQRRRLPIPEVRDDFNWIVGEHTLSFGGSFKFPKASNFLGSDYNSYTLGVGGNIAGLSGTTGIRPADIQATGTTNTTQFDRAFVLALGRVGNVSSIYNFNAAGVQQPSGTGANRRFRYYQTELYAGDAWKVNKNLTVSYGVRYSLYTVPYETLGAESIPSIGFNDYFTARVKANNAGVGGTASVGSAAIPNLTYNLGGKANGQPDYYKGNPHDFAPRFAFAYNPTSLPKTVFNASADLVYDRTVTNAINFLQNQSTFLFQNSIAQPYGTATNVTGSLATDPRLGASLTALPAPPVAASPVRPFSPYVNAAGTPTGLNTSNTTIVIDPNLKDPYSIAMNAGIQQEFGGGFILRMNYAGRLGRRLLGQADASQLLDFPDAQSGQLLSQAFAYVTTQSRNGVRPTAVQAQPWFEHVLNPNLYVGKSCGTATCQNNTQYVSYNQATYVNLGDITDTLQAYASAGALPANVGIASQFARNTYFTNKGFSNYHGLLVTLSKNLTQGTKFDLNYTFSRSIDNASFIANSVASGQGFICDVTRPRACRGPSDFDATHIISGDFVVQLPVGRGRAFLNHPNVLVEELVGGWEVSGIPQYQSGIALTTSTNAFFGSFANNDPAIYDNSHSADTNVSKHKDASNRFVMFADTNKALSHFRGPVGIEYGSRNNLRGPSQFFLDAGLGKRFQLLPDNKLKLQFRADFFNVLNHPTFGGTLANTTLNITSANFGVLVSPTSQRVGQFSLRLEF